MGIKKYYLKFTNRLRYAEYKAQLDHINSYRSWIAGNRPFPPPHIVKQLLVRENAGSCGGNIFIETGTFKGDMVDAMASHFTRVYSIELSETLHRETKLRFQSNRNVNLLCGDSAVLLPRILKEIDVPCLFWLDGHYSGGETAKGGKETPILAELQAIAAHPVRLHTILIDDARLFIGANDYPSIAQLRGFLSGIDPTFEMEIHDDVIFIRRGKTSWIHSQNTDFADILKKSLRTI